MPEVAYVNGSFVPFGEATIHIEDRGLQFGDAVYEVVAFFNRKFLDLDPHLARLERSLAALSIQGPMGRDALQEMFAELVRRNRLDLGIVYLQITRGMARREHAFPQPAPQPTVIATARPLDLPAVAKRQREGVGIILYTENRWRRPDIKSTSLLGNVLAKEAARAAACYEAVYVDEQGTVSEGTSSNIWAVMEDGVLATRNPDGGILAGITRASLLGLLKGKVKGIAERSFTKAELLGAKEAFLTGTTSFVMPVVKIDGRKLGNGAPGPVTARLVREYWGYIEGQTGFATV